MGHRVHVLVMGLVRVLPQKGFGFWKCRGEIFSKIFGIYVMICSKVEWQKFEESANSNMLKIWQKMKKILVQLALIFQLIIPGTWESNFGYPIHH